MTIKRLYFNADQSDMCDNTKGVDDMVIKIAYFVQGMLVQD